MRSRIWRRCSREGSMIWERCKREEPETGLGRSLFTPLPRHASVFDYEGCQLCFQRKSVNLHRLGVTANHTGGSQRAVDVLGVHNLQRPRGVRRGCRRAAIRLTAAFCPARGIPRVSSRGGGRINRSAVRSEQATGRREGKGGEGEGSSRRVVARAVERAGEGGSCKGGCGCRVAGEEGTRCNIWTTRERVPNNRGTFFPSTLALLQQPSRFHDAYVHHCHALCRKRREYPYITPLE